MVMDGNTQCKQVPIANSVQSLDKSIQELGNTVDILCSRLDSFCAPQTPQNPSSVKSVGGEAKSPARAGIDEFTSRIQANIRRLDETLSRLEI